MLWMTKQGYENQERVRALELLCSYLFIHF